MSDEAKGINYWLFLTWSLCWKLQQKHSPESWSRDVKSFERLTVKWRLLYPHKLKQTWYQWSKYCTGGENTIWINMKKAHEAVFVNKWKRTFDEYWSTKGRLVGVQFLDDFTSDEKKWIRKNHLVFSAKLVWNSALLWLCTKHVKRKLCGSNFIRSRCLILLTFLDKADTDRGST